MTNPEIIHSIIEMKQRRYSVDVAFEDLLAYANFVEHALRLKEYELITGATLSEIFQPGLSSDEDIERYQNERRQLKEEFPQALRNATLGFTQSVLEAQLISIAKIASKWRGCTLESLDKRKGESPLRRLRKYFEELCRLRIDADAWNSISHYQNVRNSLVHNEGNISIRLSNGANAGVSAKAIGAQIDGEHILLRSDNVTNHITTCRHVCKELLQRLDGQTI